VIFGILPNYFSGSQPKTPEGATLNKCQLCNTRKQQGHKKTFKDNETFRMYPTSISLAIENVVSRLNKVHCILSKVRWLKILVYNG